MKRILILAFLLAVLVGAVFLLDSYPAALVLPDDINTEIFATLESSPISLAFSEEGHFFANHVTVEIIASSPHAEIYYTLDGSKPTTYSLRYSAPLVFNAQETTQAVVLRAIAVYEDETSEPLTHTYFIGANVHERFNAMVFSVSTNPEYFYCFDYGIFVEGRTRQEYLEENPGTYINPTTPANFNWRGLESERIVNVEAFTPAGERVLSQVAGARVFGSWSRAETVKSLRLIARREYTPDTGRFHYEFFPSDVVQDGFDTPVTAYNTLLLRNGGNDRNHGILRNELGYVLARRAGFLDVSPVRAAALFVNGEYYGYVWLQTRFDEHYLQELYGTPTRDFDVVGRGEWWFRNATEKQEEALTYKNHFAWRDLNNNAEFAALEALVDIDNLLWYYAFQIFLGNGDWPHNNLRRWRYTGEPFEGMAPELDGRWRYALWDLDQIFGLFGQNYRRPTFQQVLVNDNYNGQLIRNILTRQDMAERFTMIMCDIAANVINYEIVREVFEELYGEIAREVELTIKAGLLSHWVSQYSISAYHERTFEFAERRHITMFNQLASLFDFEQDMFIIYIVGGEAIIGTQRGTSSRYFAHLTVPVQPVLPQHTAFDHWIVNGERIYDETFYVTAADAVNEMVEITLVTRPEVPPLLIYSAFVSPQGSGITLVSATDDIKRTEGFFLSNQRDNLQRFRLPTATLQPGRTLEFAGSNSRIPSDLFRIRLDFNVREGRRVFLSDENGVILDTVLVN